MSGSSFINNFELNETSDDCLKEVTVFLLLRCVLKRSHVTIQSILDWSENDLIWSHLSKCRMLLKLVASNNDLIAMRASIVMLCVVLRCWKFKNKVPWS